MSTFAAMSWKSDGPFRVLIFNAENFEKWRNGELCFTIWRLKPEEIGEFSVFPDRHCLPIDCYPNLYIVFENTRAANLHLTLSVGSITWCKQITGYRTEYQTRYDNTPLNTGYCLLTLALISIMGGLAVVLIHHQNEISVMPGPSLEKKNSCPPPTTDNLYES